MGQDGHGAREVRRRHVQIQFGYGTRGHHVQPRRRPLRGSRRNTSAAIATGHDFTTSDTFKIQVAANETAASDNVYIHVIIRVAAADGTIVGTIFNASDDNELTTDYYGIKQKLRRGAEHDGRVHPAGQRSFGHRGRASRDQRRSIQRWSRHSRRRVCKRRPTGR
ncbi:MAG: hypothetical protein MZV63_15615 [Marinilabiliales bacterium]|nr:hypothetical protein [Marinilabiliales bacterium]